MNYEQKYKKALERAKYYYSKSYMLINSAIENIFPELKESEDERIRKGLIKAVSRTFEGNKLFGTDVTREEALAWLERQGEKPQDKSTLEGIKKEKVDNQNYIKPTDKVKPKFHKGDWIIHQGTENIYQVVACIDNQYQLKYGDNYTVQKCADVDRCARLWNITKDAKDGDVLTIDGFIFIYKNIDEDNGVHYHCHYELNKHGDDEQFAIATSSSIMGTRDCYYSPASREQCDLIFSKMRESGYEWDVEKKEVKKIELKILLNANEVIEWLDNNQPSIKLIAQFKQDFGL